MGNDECFNQPTILFPCIIPFIKEPKMKRFIIPILFLICINLQAQDQPKLVVGIVVDQMRADYIYRYWDKFEEGGFKRMIADGFFCRNAHFNYIPTYTGPGHASIFTGTTPMEHGIIANTWFDKTQNKNVYCVGDSSATSIGSDNDNGKMSSHRLLAPTLGDAIRISSQFKGKSIGISIKDRGAILPAGHSANAAYWMDYQSGSMITSSAYMNTLPKWVTDFNKRHVADNLAENEWELSLDINRYVESTSDNTTYEKPLIKDQDPVFPYNVKRAISENSYYSFACTPYGNTYLRQFAELCLINEDLGQDKWLDLLTISFSSPDMIGHMFGPQSIEIEDTYIKLDLEIASLLNALDTRVGEDNYIVFLTADHAAAQVPQYLQDNGVRVGYFNSEAYITGLKKSLANKFGVDGLVSHFSNQQIFLNWELLNETQLETELVNQEIRKYSLAFKGIANILSAEQLQHALPPDNFSKLAANGWNPKRSGDIMIQLLPGWMSYGKQGTTHGSSYSYDTHVPVIFYGAGIGKGELVEPIEITRIAPTISVLTRTAFPDASGHEIIPIPEKD